MANTMNKHTLLLTLCSLMSACSINPTASGQWFKGNTHAHTTLSGHGDTTPDEVARYYLDNEYNFLILSEHNVFIDPESVTLPTGSRGDFILIPGQEITSDNSVHTTAMNTRGLVQWQMDGILPTISDTIQYHVDQTHGGGGEAILNHPNYQYAVTSQDIADTTGLLLFELYNGHPVVNNRGDKDHISTEAMWDELLTSGMNVFGVSSDDAHDFKVLSQDASNPGRGWVMVWSHELSPNDIAAAMAKGDFYSSSGVTLKSIGLSASTYSVVVDEAATAKNLKSPHLRGDFVADTKEGYRIEFIGKHGVVLATIFGVHGKYVIAEPDGYVRVRITFTRARPDIGFEEYYAWGQPVNMRNP